ncbi:MAG: hypothetical protein EKK41_25255 [Hyphomicrobiales bacterium]|nr:MAG: hypothetical protein EKK41_25255 [Hyphomicrobiales bacterium]
MTVKQAIVSELGEDRILLPELIARSLGANDQVKYYFALLQAARDNAEHPSVPAMDLKAERIASKLDDVWLDEVVAGARKEKPGTYRLPHGPEILRRITGAIRTMLECLPPDERTALRARADALKFVETDHGAISKKLIGDITSGDRARGDSLHLVVMDAHKAINRLQAETAVETVSGARVHGLSKEGRGRVEAFMLGLNRTAPLKFDHPGLATTATEHDGRLLIQNDIGTTDAHVLVIRVENLKTTLTYTDIHGARLKFFKSLFEAFEVAWETTEQRRSEAVASGEYMLATGTFQAADEGELRRYLGHLGSRIVYLIDWNKMRKRLRGFVGKEPAIAILKWAADNDYGHRGLLEIGGEEALADAIEFAAASRLRYGQRLDALISEKRAIAFLQEAMKAASLGLRQRRSRRAINDEIKARLRGYFESERLGIFRIAAAHAAIGYDLALALYEAILHGGAGSDASWLTRFTATAARLESKADLLLNEARHDIKRFDRPQALLRFAEHTDDAIDELEEAANLVDLAHSADCAPETLARLRPLAEQALGGSQELVKLIECAASITRADVRDDLDEFMSALERLVGIEHQADEELRSVRRWLIEQASDQRQIIVLHELAKAIEAATDGQTHAAQALREYIMEEVIA